MSAERFEFAIFTLRKEIGRRDAQALAKVRRLPKDNMARNVRETLAEFEARDREIAELEAAIKRLREPRWRG